mgnify:CR=1 FL=1
MENDLPYGRDSGISLFRKIKERLSGIPTYLLAFLAVFTATLILAGFYILLSPDISLKDLLNKSGITEEANGEKNISEPYKGTPKPLATGRQTYLISGSKKGAPKISEATIDPIDPKEGASQTFSVKALALEAGPIADVSVTMITDNEKKTYPLKSISGTNLDGTWQGTWSLKDSYLYTYQAAIKAKSATSEWEVTLTFR